MSFPWDGSENRYQTLLQTKKEQFSDSNSRFPQTQPLDKETFDNQLRVQNDRNHIFSNNSSQILNNPSIPLNIYQINPEQYQQPASQISRREIVLDEKTRKRQEDLLSQSYQNLQNPQNGNLDLNNYIRTPNLQIYQTQEYNRNQNPNFQHQDLNNNFNRNSKQNQNPNHNYNYNRNPNQSYQNLEPINNNSNRNHNVDSFIQQRPDSNARSFLNTRSIIEKPGVSYGQDLKKQILMKDTDKKNAKFMEKLLEQKLLADRDDNDWFGKQGAGAPVRDQFGNIITSRKKPTNLNYMSSEWSSPAFNHLKTNEMNLLRNSMPNINQNDISSIIKRTSNELNELNMDNFQQNPQINVYSPTENPTSFNFNKTHQNIDVNPLLDLEAFNKKEQEKAVQNENYQLMEAKRKEKENQKLILKQEADLNDIRLQKEKEEMEARRMFAFGNQNLESRNLYETNFDMGKLMGKTSKVNFAPNRTLRENTQMQFTARTEKSFKRPRTPLEEVERDIRDLQQREEGLKIQKRILQELPFEVSKTVQTTVDIEMQKLKNELNFQQNLLGEQIMGLKGQLLQSNEQRQESEKQVKNLHKEIQKTQLVDEIRQRELYMALILKNRKPTIFHTVTQKLEEAEMHNFHFPEKPKPYYNVYDPSIEDLEFRNKDFHDILINRTEMIQNSVHNEKMVKGSNWNQKSREMERYSYGVELDNESVPNLPDDFSNLQGLTQARIIDDGDQVYYLDTYNANMKRLEAFEDKDARQELARLDGQLFNLLNSVNRGKDTFDDLNQINQYSSLSKNFQINDHNADFYD